MASITDHIKASNDEKLLGILDKYIQKWSFDVEPGSFIEKSKITLNLENLQEPFDAFVRTNHVLIQLGT